MILPAISTCEVCGKHRNGKGHPKCSRILKKHYAKGTAARAEQEAIQAAIRKETISKGTYSEDRLPGNHFIFARSIGLD